jgi:hypothetical protein
MTIVYEALAPYQVEWSFKDLVEKCFTKEYEARIKKPPLTRSFLRASVNYHLRRMIKRGMVKEASPQP